MAERYTGREIRGRAPVKVHTLASRHDPKESLRLKYYIRTPYDLLKTARAISRDETTGPWVGQSPPTPLFQASQADVAEVVEYGPGEGVITVSAPVSNFDLDSELLYQFLMLMIGGPILEFVYYEQVAFLDFALPDKLLARFPGPKFGIRGTRKLLGLADGDLIVGTILKPCCGLTADEVARKCYEASVGGVRFIKDDEKMLGAPYCPASEKIPKVAAGLKAAAAETGRNTLYAPHIVAPPLQMRDVCLRAIDAGATALMFNAFVQGFGVLHGLSSDPAIGVPIYVHSGGRSGWSTGPRRIDDVVFARLIRLAGGDYFQTGVMGQTEVLFTGREPDLLVRLHETFTQPWGQLRDTACVAAGGLDVRNLVDNLQAFGTDFMALAGTGILNHPRGIREGVQAMGEAAEAWRRGVALDAYAKDHEALRLALQKQK